MITARFRKSAPSEQAVLNRVEVTLLGDDPAQRARFDSLIETEHYLNNSRLVDEQLRYVAHVEGEWVALLCVRALRPITSRRATRGSAGAMSNGGDGCGCSPTTAAFSSCPASIARTSPRACSALNTARLSADWEHAYAHPVLAVESFVDGQLFRGTCYKAQGWSQLGETSGHGRHAQDYYVEHQRPKQ